MWLCTLIGKNTFVNVKEQEGICNCNVLVHSSWRRMRCTIENLLFLWLSFVFSLAYLTVLLYPSPQQASSSENKRVQHSHALAALYFDIQIYANPAAVRIKCSSQTGGDGGKYDWLRHKVVQSPKRMWCSWLLFWSTSLDQRIHFWFVLVYVFFFSCFRLGQSGTALSVYHSA